MPVKYSGIVYYKGNYQAVQIAFYFYFRFMKNSGKEIKFNRHFEKQLHLFALLY